MEVTNFDKRPSTTLHHSSTRRSMRRVPALRACACPQACIYRAILQSEQTQFRRTPFRNSQMGEISVGRAILGHLHLNERG